MAPKKAGKAAKLQAALNLSRTDGTPEGWTKIVSLLCEHFALPPDLSTANALKKVYGKLDTIYPRMKRELEQTTDHRIKGAIVEIYTQLCADAVLRNRLFQLGFLTQLLSVLDAPCRCGLNVAPALDSLATLTHHGGMEVRIEVAKATCEPLLRILRDLADDPQVPQLAIRVLAHTIAGAVSKEAKQHDPKLTSTLPLASISQAFVDALRRPNATGEMAAHVTSCLVDMSRSGDIQLTKPMVDLLVAGLRYQDWLGRVQCLAGLLSSHIPDVRDDPRTVDPTKVRRHLSGFADAPAIVRKTMQAVGVQGSKMYRKLASNRDFFAALGSSGYASGGDMYEAAKKIAEIILCSDPAFLDGSYSVTNPVNGQMMLPAGSLKSWSDALPICAKAIREKGIASETHLADILDLKFLFMRKRDADAADLAQRALRLNPDFAYAYYILVLTQGDEPALRAAMRGIQCTPGPQNLTPFLRLQLLHHASELSCAPSIAAIEAPGRHGNASREVGVALMLKAKENWEAFLAEAAPDDQHMRSACSWLLVLRIMTATTLSGDLRELKALVDRLEFVKELDIWLGIREGPAQIHLVVETVLKSFAAAQRDWGALIAASVPGLHAETGLVETKEKMEEALAAWMEGSPVAFKSCCGCEASTHDGHGHDDDDTAPHPAESKTKTYRCFNCHNHSAMLRKCAGCNRARYCDATCQKQHWTTHKKECSVLGTKK
uniref:SET and MYND-domain-containing protein 3 n=1 Tax=Mycena chlorophos TaxID=658473 RepID=A0ABQ0LUL5_MYCCL|nr:SET and MYND-domain-containing protein 3 [Mycena chlorophos]